MNTEAGTNPKVAALIYISAFAPDKGESVNTLIADPPPGAPVPPILPPWDGFLFLGREKFHPSFAADLSPEEAAFMADSQVPWGVDALSGGISDSAWRSKPSWYLVTTDDRMIPHRPGGRRLLGWIRPLWRSRPAIRTTCRGLRPSQTSSRRPLPG